MGDGSAVQAVNQIGSKRIQDMAKGIENPEFPHSCTIRRVARVSPFSNEKEHENIYAGPCRREASKNIRTFSKGTSTVGQQISVDYRVCVPGIVKIRVGDIVTVDFGLDTDKDAIISQTNPSALKTPRYPNGRTEFYYALPQT